jgi:N6-adenosine-specific RNA methylase IME4
VKYRTIVADPPWAYEDGCVALGPGHGILRANQPLPYSGMSHEAICALSVSEMADVDCRLFLWTTNRYIEDAFEVVRSWRFRYRQTLVWHKTDTNLVGSVAPNSAEFLLVATRGTPARLSTLPSSIISTPHGRSHSRKPEAWLDAVEQVSPGPYLEMFARRNRLGWDTWGDEALNHVGLTSTTGSRDQAAAPE